MIKLFHPYITREARDAVTEVLKSGWIGQGSKTEEFERAFASYVGSEYAVATNSATTALHLAVMVAGIEEGDEVLTTALTFVSTNHVILYQRAKPVFVDVDPDTLNIDLKKAAKLVTPRTKAIMVVHYAGNPVDLDELYDFANRYHLEVIQDAAHACGAIYNGFRIGSNDLTCFSFHAVKNLPLGDGGMVTTNDSGIYEQLRNLRWMGIDTSTFERTKNRYKWQYGVKDVGIKCHMNDINAAMGVVQLPYLDAWNSRRREIAHLYRHYLPNVRFVESSLTTSQHLCVVRLPNRDYIHDKLAEAGIDTGVHYTPNTVYDMYSDYGDRTTLPETYKAYDEILSLPVHLNLTDEDVIAVATEIQNELL